MKVRNIFASFLKIFIGFACAAALFLCGSSLFSGKDNGGFSLPAISIGPPTVEFAAGSFRANTEELTVVLEPEEIPLLDQFTDLRSADLRGSLCYKEIAAWGEAHPETALRYTVPLPDGTTVENDAESLDFSDYDGGQVAAAAELLAYLPKLKTIDLGSRPTGAILTAEELSLVREACPQAQLSYAVDLAGQHLSLNTVSVDLSTLSHDDLASAPEALACLDKLTYIDLGSQSEERGLSWDDVGQFQAACPQATVAYRFSLFGKNLSTLDEILDFNHISMDDEGAAVREILPYMKKCAYLDMDFCGVSNESMASIRDEFPDIKVVWRIWFAKNYSVRTDVEKILASKPSKGGNVSDSDAQVLKYCTDVKYLDLGHNQIITDLSFVNYMPKLEVLVVAMNELGDISPLANCPHLEYLELNSNAYISDLTPLSGLTELRHLNIANCPNISDISPLFGLTELERLWIGRIDPVPKEQVDTMRAVAPNCEIDTEVSDPTSGKWRILGLTERAKAVWHEVQWEEWELAPRYELLREQFGYVQEAYSFSWLDPLYNPHD